MKRAVLGGLLALILAVGTAFAQTDSAVRTLRGGYQTKERVHKDGTKQLLVKFPARCAVKKGTEAEMRVFNACLDKAVKLVFPKKSTRPSSIGPLVQDGVLIGVFFITKYGSNSRPTGPISE